jgi:YD repeat-containing protein
MDKLYDQDRWAVRCDRFTNIDTRNDRSYVPISVKDRSGRTVTYDYYALGESISKSNYKRISRIALGWVLYAISLGYFARYRSIHALMYGRRVDHIYLSHKNPPTQSASTTVKEVVLQEKRDPIRSSRDIKLDNVLIRGPVSELRHSDSTALEILLFADETQSISPILEEYFKEKDPGDQIHPIIKVLEQSLGIKFGESEQNNERIILLFLERIFRRAFHGTSKAAAKSMIQHGISYSRDAKGHDYDELDGILRDCKISMSSFYEIHKNSGFDEACCFYVSQMAVNALMYANNNGPEWFNTFRRYGRGDNGEFDRKKFRTTLLKENPACIDVERVVQFAEKHWNICAPDKKNAALVIVEKDEEYAKREIISLLSCPSSSLNCFLPYLTFKDLVKIYADTEITDKKDLFRQLSILKMRLQQSINERLCKENTFTPPQVIRAVKVHRRLY